MLTRFELFVIVRNQVKNRDLLRRALAVEAIMEDLARVCGEDPEVWALLGLGAQVDAQERGDEHAQRTLACLERLGLPLATAAENAVQAMRRVRGDLHL